MNIIIAKTQEEINDVAYKIVKNIVLKKPNATLGLPTGQTPLGLYKTIIANKNNSFLSYENITVVNLDEYVGLPKNDKNSYYHFMRYNLIDHINVNLDNFHIPNGNNSDLNSACKEYEEILEQKPRDLQILGLGSNGHIGFNEPGTPFSSKTRIVDLNEETRLANARFFNSLEDVPKQALTMGIKNILDANKIVIMAFGKNKADAVYSMIEEPISANCPASILRSHNDLLVLLDNEASSKLSNSVKSKAYISNTFV